MRSLSSLLLLFLAGACLPPLHGSLESSRLTYPADGVSAGKIVLHRGLFRSNEALRSPEGNPSLRILSHTRNKKEESLYFRSTLQPGRVLFRTSAGRVLEIRFLPVDPLLDEDGDGFPDRAELKSEEDRAAFRAWFVRIAQSQFVKRSARWNRGERDCSGLVRFAYREALKLHDSRWQQKTQIPLDKNLPDIRAFHYPDVPVLGERIFLAAPPAKEATPDRETNEDDSSPRAKGRKLLERFSVFADAGTLHRFQTFPVSREIEDARPGDLLFFQDPANPRFPYHSMIVVKTEQGAAGEESKDTTLLIYHTGTGSLMKRVPVRYLEGSLKFRADPSNPNFLGVFRFHILD